MKVVHLLASLRPSGMERMLQSAGGYFRELGITTIVVGQGTIHPFASSMEEAGLDVRTVGSLRSRSGRREWESLLRELQPDVVHIHTEGAWATTVLSTKRALRRATVVRTVHSVFDARGVWGIKRRAQGVLVDRFVGGFVTCSEDVRVNEAKFRRSSVTIFNWVDDRFVLARERRMATGARVRSGRRPLVVVVGNCSAIKSHELATQHLLELGVDLAHYGDERYALREELEQLTDLDRAGHLAARGAGDPLESLLQGDVFLMPSQHEGMGMALAEALTVGIPALVNDVPGLQWARYLPGVTMVANSKEAWFEALSSFKRRHSEGTPERLNGDPLPDLSAERGAREYVSVYRQAMSTGR